MTTIPPKVLFISRTEISQFNSQGAARGGWFRDWPKDRIAHVFSSPASPGETPFCGHNYLLTGKDRRFGRLFDALKRTAQDGALDEPESADSPKPGSGGRLFAAVKRLGKQMLLDTGLWEVLFSPVLSRSLLTWIKEFRPDVIYAAPTDLSYMLLTRWVSRKFDLPVVVHIDDDWPNTLYRETFLGPVMYPLVDRVFRRLLRESAVCLGISDQMAREYHLRYGVKTDTIACCDEYSRFVGAAPQRLASDDEISITYCGGLHLNRWRSLVDLLAVLDDLRREGHRIGFVLHGDVPGEARASLEPYTWLRVLPAPTHDAVPGVLKGSDLLFLAEGFDHEYLEYIRLSVSSKAHLYMMSERPILVYGPPEAGVVQYARESGWGHVVDSPSRMDLKAAVLKLVSDTTLRQQLVNRGLAIALENHEATVVRERLRSILALVAQTRSLDVNGIGVGESYV